MVFHQPDLPFGPPPVVVTAATVEMVFEVPPARVVFGPPEPPPPSTDDARRRYLEAFLLGAARRAGAEAFRFIVEWLVGELRTAERHETARRAA